MNKIFTLFIILFLSCNLFADPIDKETAKKVATNFFKNISHLKSKDFSIKKSFETKLNSTTTFYTFNFESGGWIIVSADDIATPILAYSQYGSIEESNLNPAVKYWLDGYSSQIYSEVSKKSKKNPDPDWQKILNQSYQFAEKTVAPLIATKWDQSQYYNDLCPADLGSPNGYGGHVPVGCVATATAQIMYYHKYPTKGIGAYSYQHSKYGDQSANFGATTYNWNSMPNPQAYSSNTAVATIMYHLGVALNMDYSANGSSANSSNVVYVLKNFYNYDNTIKVIERNTLNNDNIWMTLLKTELDASRPVLYSGHPSSGKTGHAFVCDGYDASSPTKFHFNWGWSGYSDGFFAINALTPTGNNFSYFNTIVIGIKPRTNPDLICRIFSPAKAESFPIGTNITINPTIVSGTPTKIDLFIDDMFIESVTSAPFTFNWNTTGFAAGPHVLRIEATNGTSTDIHESYIILKSNVWESKTIQIGNNFYEVEQIHIVNSQVIWAKIVEYGSDGKDMYTRKFIKSTDGGNTWNFGTINFTNAEKTSIANIIGISDTKAYACMYPHTDANGGKIVMTEDGGTTWTVQTSADFSQSWADWVYFFDANNGVCMGDSYNNQFVVYTTSNGGTNWTRVSNIPSLSGEAGTVNFFDAIGDNIWFGTNSGRVCKSTNKGLTWNVYSSGMGDRNSNVKFKDANTGFVFGSSQNSSFLIRKTTDGGATWNTIEPKGAFNSQNICNLPTTSSWFNVGDNGAALSNDDLAALYWIDYGTPFSSICFLDNTYGWAGSGAAKSGVTMYKWVGSTQPTFNSTVKFIVKDNNSTAIQDAKVEFNNQSKNTDASGEVTFTVSSFGNPDYYKVSKTGFETQTAFVTISNSNSTINITLSASVTVTFTVKDAQGAAVSNASVVFNSETKTTDNNGNAVFTLTQKVTDIPYFISKSQFSSAYGLISTSNQNINQSITLQAITTGIEDEVTFKVCVFPNPATEKINILSDNKIKSVKIYNIAGQNIYNQTATSNTVQINTSNLQNGMYLLQISNEKSTKTVKIQINK